MLLRQLCLELGKTPAQWTTCLPAVKLRTFKADRQPPFRFGRINAGFFALPPCCDESARRRQCVARHLEMRGINWRSLFRFDLRSEADMREPLRFAILDPLAKHRPLKAFFRTWAAIAFHDVIVTPSPAHAAPAP